MRVDLADQEYLIASAGDRFADHLFCAPFSVHFGGVDQGHAQFDAQAQRRDFFSVTGVILAHSPGALANDRDLDASQFERPHEYLR
ncbi:hypothetical protein D3C73_1246410 [compost metagenome]